MNTSQASVEDLVRRGEKVVLGFTGVNTVMGGIPFLTGPLIVTSDYVMFIAVKRAMKASFKFKDVFSIVAPTVKGTFAFAMWKTVVDAMGWSWWVTIPTGAVVSAATTYALGMFFVQYNASSGQFTTAEAETFMRDAALSYVDEKTNESSKIKKMANQAITKMFDLGSKNPRHAS